jgi:hypothetical protein
MNPAITRRTLDTYRRRFHLLDWRIQGREVGGVPEDGHEGDVEMNIDYLEATITLYPDSVAARNGDCFDVVVHEFGEIIAAQACSVLPAKVYDSELMVRVRDRFAEHFSLIFKGIDQK